MSFLYAFDLLELNGADLRREPIEVCKATLASILRKARHGVRLNCPVPSGRPCLVYYPKTHRVEPRDEPALLPKLDIVEVCPSFRRLDASRNR
jgi:hypothetical protein